MVKRKASKGTEKANEARRKRPAMADVGGASGDGGEEGASAAAAAAERQLRAHALGPWWEPAAGPSRSRIPSQRVIAAAADAEAVAAEAMAAEAARVRRAAAAAAAAAAIAAEASRVRRAHVAAASAAAAAAAASAAPRPTASEAEHAESVARDLVAAGICSRMPSQYHRRALAMCLAVRDGVYEAVRDACEDFGLDVRLLRPAPCVAHGAPVRRLASGNS